MRSCGVAALLCLSAVQCNRHDRSAPDSTGIYRDLLSGLIGKRYRVEFRSATPLVVESRSVIPLEGWKPKLPELRSDTLANFRKRNEVRVPIRLSEVDGRPVHLLTDSDLAELFRQERDVDSNWKSFYLRFPDAAGLIGLSRIGLSENGGQALVYLSFSFGSLAGHGALFLLERRSGRWRIVAEHVVWVS